MIKILGKKLMSHAQNLHQETLTHVCCKALVRNHISN